MAISPDELRKKTFAVVPKGYDRPEVNRYLSEIAKELQQFNAGAAGEATAEAMPIGAAQSNEPAVDDGRPAEATPREATITSADEFDRVGAEISMMLRQAQDSAVKIRQDAEAEARELIDQVRIDIEADRVAHESAAGELISRTEERATAIRISAEEYGRDTRARADEYAQTRHTTVDAELVEAEAQAQATRQHTADYLTAANTEATSLVGQATMQSQQMIENAKMQSQQIIENAKMQSQQIIEDATMQSQQILGQTQAESERLVSEANASLQSLLEAEARTREDLAQTRLIINSALDQSSIADLDNALAEEYPA